MGYGLQQQFGIDYAVEKITKNPYGKPSLVEYNQIQYNISHCMGGAAVAISCGTPVGVDIENIRPFHTAVVKRVFTPDEQEALFSSQDQQKAFFSIWTLKESYIKAIGKGLSYDMRSIQFQVDDNGQVTSNCKNAQFHLWQIQSKYTVALCKIN